MTYADGFQIGQNLMYDFIIEAIEAAEKGKPLERLTAALSPKTAELQERVYLAVLGEEHTTQIKPYKG